MKSTLRLSKINDVLFSVGTIKYSHLLSSVGTIKSPQLLNARS